MSGILKPSIPSTQPISDRLVNDVLTAMKGNIELMTGVRNGSPQLAQLASTATLAQVIATLNVVIQRLNQTGQ